MLEILETDSPNTIGVKDYWCRAKRESWDNWIDSHYSKALVNAIENNNDNTLSIEASNYVRIDFILNNKNIKMVKESYLKRKNTVLSTAKVLCKNSQSK